MKLNVTMGVSMTGRASLPEDKFQDKTPFFHYSKTREDCEEPNYDITKQEFAEMFELCWDCYEEVRGRIKSPPQEIEEIPEEKVINPTQLRRDTIIKMVTGMAEGNKVVAKAIYENYTDVPTSELKGKKLLEVYEKIVKDYHAWETDNGST